MAFAYKHTAHVDYTHSVRFAFAIPSWNRVRSYKFLAHVYSVPTTTATTTSHTYKSHTSVSVCVLWLRLRCALHFGYGILPDALRLRMRFYWRYGEIELDKTADCCRMSTMFCANDDGNDYFNFRAAIFSQQYNNGAMCILIALWPNGQYSTQLVHWSKWDEKQCYFLIDIAWLVRILSAHPYIVASLFAWSNRIRSICVEYQTNNKFSEDRMLMAIIKANMYK